MEKLSLVGITAIDIVRVLAKDATLILTSYNKPIGVVIPATYSSKREFYATVDKVARELFEDEKDQ